MDAKKHRRKDAAWFIVGIVVAVLAAPIFSFASPNKHEPAKEVTTMVLPFGRSTFEVFNPGGEVQGKLYCYPNDNAIRVAPVQRSNQLR